MKAFDNSKYYSIQKKAIEDRISKFKDKLYLEIGGKLLYDEHAKNVLPGFDPTVKIKIINDFKDDFELLFCVNANDIIKNRQLKPNSRNFIEECITLIKEYEQVFSKKPKVVINNISAVEIEGCIKEFIRIIEISNFQHFKRFFIKNYPKDTDTIISNEGYGKDDYIDTKKRLVIVSGAASNSGKLSTAMGQIYNDSLRGLNSGYAKYELFPIWNLPLDHPVNLAYEAATADIGDYNLIDEYHKMAYGINSVNYNRDIEAFEILKSIAEKIVSKDNYIRTYKSPTDMGINMAGFCIIDDDLTRKSAIEEIIRRRDYYKSEYKIGRGKEEWYKKCEDLINHIIKKN